ncbi:Hypothetical protein R9X50_00359700 [Acrodontium crateriforme]|uniref:PH domain-containing protein n=1 Tax=Acrodontium crateriforme TaxID=150365 RepID=A0AAQ3M9D8_9PEZI|nr:Hypothetical protein R9X50_00359700 [Acrodontium crateriforme]
MSRSSHDGSNHHTGSWGRRKSFLGLSSLSSSFEADGADSHASAPSKTLKKHKHTRSKSRISTDLHPHAHILSRDDDIKSAPAGGPAQGQRPTLSVRSNARRGPGSSVFESLRFSRSNTEESPPGEPLSAVSTTSSIGFPEGAMDGLGLTPAKTVVEHGEVQTSAGMFRKKKKEYLVLTETHILRYKSQAKAAETFPSIPYPTGRSSAIKHGHMPSSSGSQGSSTDLQSLTDSYDEKGGRVPLRQVVATDRLDESKPSFAVEICYLDEESGHASSMSLQFSCDDERDSWLTSIRKAVTETRRKESTPISALNLEAAVRIVEREHDYDPDNCAIYKVVQKHSSVKARTSASSDDLSKIASTVCFLAIGVHKLHLIQVAKSAIRSSSPSLTHTNTQLSYGLLNMIAIRVGAVDDSFELVFRQPLQRAKHLYLASSASHEIAARLRYAENFLRPECEHRLLRFQAPPDVGKILLPTITSEDEHGSLDRTLSAYCIAYGGKPDNVRYTINYYCEDAPRFELLAPTDPRRPEYDALELLAIMRTLRYNESFGSISFAGVPLDALNGLHDQFGFEYVCSYTKQGAPLRLSPEELGQSCLLVQEVRALAATSKTLRRMDFSGCITSIPAVPVDSLDEETFKIKDIGCGIVEALFPLCKHQTTNVDWVCLNGIYLSETDLDYLVAAAVEKSCHFRAIELNRCGLNDRSMGLILDSLRAHENTLEALELAGNTARLKPATFDTQLGMFGFIRKLNLSYINRTSGDEPLLQPETLLIWRLEELTLSGTTLNSASVDSISTYLAHPQSNSLRELLIDNAYLSGGEVACLMRSMTHDVMTPRELHFDISHNNLSKDMEQVTQAIATGMAPTHLTMSAIEYREESQFRKMITALTVNKTIRCLDMSQTALPGDATEETCRTIERFLSENETLLDLDMSGEDSRLATSKFGTGFNEALIGLIHNTTMQSFHIEKQKLGLQGASALADVLKGNKTLRELHCENNEIPLQGLTDLVNSLIENTSLIYLPTMDDGRAAAFKSAELTMKGIPDLESPPQSPPRKNSSLSSTSAVRRGLASVRRSAVRSATTYTPSFPALPRSDATSTGKSLTRPSSSGMPLTLPTNRKRQSSTPLNAGPLNFTVQDIQTTQRLLTEQWDRQCFRLNQYLHRNWCLLNNVPVDMEIPDEKFERPENIGSLSKMLEQVKVDTTPRADLSDGKSYFDHISADILPSSNMTPKSPSSMEIKRPVGNGNGNGNTDANAKGTSKPFLLSGDGSADSSSPDDDGESDWAAETIKAGLLEEPKTPTQLVFPR